MRALLLGVLPVLAACAAPVPTTVTQADSNRELVQIGGEGVWLSVERTPGEAGVILHDIPLPLVDVWRALPATFDAAGLDGAGAVDARRHIYGYPNAVFPRRIAENRLSAFLDCGHSPGGINADIYRITGSVLAAVRPGNEPGHSQVEVTVVATGRPREVGGQAVRCSSNGRLERILARTAVFHAAGGT